MEKRPLNNRTLNPEVIRDTVKELRVLDDVTGDSRVIFKLG